MRYQKHTAMFNWSLCILFTNRASKRIFAKFLVFCDIENSQIFVNGDEIFLVVQSVRNDADDEVVVLQKPIKEIRETILKPIRPINSTSNWKVNLQQLRMYCLPRVYLNYWLTRTNQTKLRTKRLTAVKLIFAENTFFVNFFCEVACYLQNFFLSDFLFAKKDTKFCET